MYKVIRIERYINTVFRDDFVFDDRAEAEKFFGNECKRLEVVDVALYYCVPHRDGHELSRFVRNKAGKGTVRKQEGNKRK